MEKFAASFLLLILWILAPSCAKEDAQASDAGSIVLTGTLKKTAPSITTYQYGAFHMDTVALRSNSIDLNLYVDELVTVRGYQIEGYPLSGGPVYVEVEEIAPVGLSPGSGD